MPDDIAKSVGVSGDQAGEPSVPVTFDKWLETADPEVKRMYEEHTSGLLNTVKATRSERDALRDQVKELLGKAEKGSALESQLTETLRKLDQAEQRAAFLEDASRPAIQCKNPKAALAIAVSEGLFLKSGAPDWESIRKSAPELFGISTPPGKAGSGTGSDVPVKSDMNGSIRRLAGRS